MKPKSQVLKRLIGLETEYAIRHEYSDLDVDLTPPTHSAIFQSFAEAIGQTTPTARADHFKEGIFLANGGAFWFERTYYTARSGLIEASTPECQSPRELVTYQRALDEMAESAIESAPGPSRVCLLKNDRDIDGEIYGAQENYEVRVATGFQLVLYRLLMFLVLPLAFISRIFYWMTLATAIVLLVVVAFLFLLSFWLIPRRHRSRTFGLLFGTEDEGPLWIQKIATWQLRACLMPLIVALYLLMRMVGFRRIRRETESFFMTRPLLGGCGSLNKDGSFTISDKAPSRNCVLGFGDVTFDRCIISIAPLLKILVFDSIRSLNELKRPFAAKHRMQIGLGDSNMADQSEYLRVATTALVLDAIESGFLKHTPRLRNPIRALKQVCKTPDGDLELTNGECISPIDLQTYYCTRCHAFLDELTEVPPEAYDIIRLWSRTLSDLRSDRESLVGQIDWVTKLNLINHSGDEATWDQRKKVDLRYHELSPRGYFRELARTELVVPMLDQTEIDGAKRSAPAGTAAARRGYYIREFAHESGKLRVAWNRVVIRKGFWSKAIRLTMPDND